MRKYTIKIFFNDDEKLSVDCDNFKIIHESHYEVIKDNCRVMTMPFCNVKYTVTVINNN